MLKGTQLLDAIRSMETASRTEQCLGCGYVRENGKPAFTSFYEAIMEARGITTAAQEKEEILTEYKDSEEQEILNDYPWIFDSKSGKLYTFDENKYSLKPVNREIIEGYEYIYKDIFVRDGTVYIDSIDRDLETNENFFTTTWLDFDNLKVTYINEEGTSEYNCKEIKLPKDIRILK